LTFLSAKPNYDKHKETYPMPKRKDDRRPRRESHRQRLNHIVTILVLAVVTLCALSSWEQKHGSGMIPTLRLPQVGFIGELLGDWELGGGDEVDVVEVGGGVPDARLTVHFQDVGQASSILIEGPEKTLLIDAAEDSEGDDVLRYIQAQGIDTLDYVIGTHPHADHIGGLDDVISEMDVGQVILPVIPDEILPDTQIYDDLLDTIELRDLNVLDAKPGQTYDLGDDAKLTILAPVGEYADLNNMSVVCRLTYGDTSFLFTSDASEGAEGDLLMDGAVLRSDVLSVAHHGSNTSSTEEFIDAVSPAIAVISCGMDNSFGHPHREVMERLQGRDVRILRTDLDGFVVVTSNGERLSAVSEE
jgi:beta-lactamase superfamily II metal-dependent hydrolase